MPGRFITFEGTEGAGKSTQIKLLAERIQAVGRKVRVLREPGGTAIGEEIRHTLKHSAENAAMTPEAELLLINASRAQLVREIIRPALAAGEIVLCDRFYHSTLAYQGYGRQLDLARVQQVIDLAVGDTRPDITLMLHVPLAISEQRRKARPSAIRDRFEEADRAFFERVEQGFRALAKSDAARIKWIDAAQPIAAVAAEIWPHIERLIE
jgi:dTMP kinase